MSPLNLNVLRKAALALCENADFGRRVSIQKNRFALRFSLIAGICNFDRFA